MVLRVKVYVEYGSEDGGVRNMVLRMEVCGIWSEDRGL